MGHGSSRSVLLTEFWELPSTGRIFGLLLFTLLTVGASASATDLIGKVTNSTTKEPAAGDEVVLLSLSEGSAKESARTKTDSAGRFRFAVADPKTPRLVRVVHEGKAETSRAVRLDRKSTRLNSSHVAISYAVFCLKKKNIQTSQQE